MRNHRTTASTTITGTRNRRTSLPVSLLNASVRPNSSRFQLSSEHRREIATADTISSSTLPVQLYCPGMRGIQSKTRGKSVEVVRTTTNSTPKPAYRRERALLSPGRQRRRHTRPNAAAVKRTPTRTPGKYTWSEVKPYSPKSSDGLLGPARKKQRPDTKCPAAKLRAARFLLGQKHTVDHVDHAVGA